MGYKMSEWLDKAKEAAKKAAEEAKKLAEAAKNADYGAMLDKTKDMAKHAADEAKKAADNIMKKETPEVQPDIVAEHDTINPVPSTEANNKEQILHKISEVERLLQEIRGLLK